MRPVATSDIPDITLWQQRVSEFETKIRKNKLQDKLGEINRFAQSLGNFFDLFRTSDALHTHHCSAWKEAFAQIPAEKWRSFQLSFKTKPGRFLNDQTTFIQNLSNIACQAYGVSAPPMAIGKKLGDLYLQGKGHAAAFLFNANPLFSKVLTGVWTKKLILMGSNLSTSSASSVLETAVEEVTHAVQDNWATTGTLDHQFPADMALLKLGHRVSRSRFLGSTRDLIYNSLSIEKDAKAVAEGLKSKYRILYPLSPALCDV